MPVDMEREIKNNEAIISLVKNHFSLSTKSFEFFKEIILHPENREIDPIFKNVIGPDFRYRVKVDTQILEKHDEGWSMFKENYYDFVETYKVTYNDFTNWKINYDGGTWKLSKLLAKWGTENSFYIDDYRLNKISTHRICNMENVEVVLSLNFADWFLCSTGESWTSCLNLESTYDECYWVGLPGLIGDPNRAMIYIASNKKKEYYGIEIDSFLSRSFAVLSSDDLLFLLKFYPNRMLGNKIFAGAFNIKIADNDYEERVGKYSLKKVYHSNERGAFPYCDTSKIYIDNDKKLRIRISKNYGGFYNISKGSTSVGSYPPFNFVGGLSYLIDNNTEIADAIDEGNLCEGCGCDLHEDDAYSAGDYVYCENCFNEYYFYCEDCDRIAAIDDLVETASGSAICDFCYERYYFTCNGCEKVYENDNLYKAKGGVYCEDCFNESFFTCEDCGEIFHKLTEEVYYQHDSLCKECYDSRKEQDKEAV